MQETKALIWLFFREYQKSGKAGRFLFFGGGGCSGNSRENPWSLILSLHFVRLPSAWPCHGWDSSRWPPAKDFIFGGSQITADGDCSHEIKRRLLLGRRDMTNLDSIFKSRDITLPTKGRLVKAMVFPVVMYGCASWTVKQAERRRIDAFGEVSWESLGLQGDATSPFWRRSTLGFLWKEWC